ncbi:MAG: cytochrome d ubiquinol oxidase subunit II [Chloroflexota bacterium]
MSLATLQIIWYVLIGILISGYAILDGFDLGVGVLSPFVARNEQERRLLLKAIGPFWDGNEVWLLTAGAALFAAFPHVYATVFSGFYLALMLLLFALILRAVSFEFRHQMGVEKWRRIWDWVFFFGSLIPAMLTGVALGNAVRGVPLNAQMEFTGNFFTLLNPFSLLVGLTGLAMFLTHGAIFLMVKTNGAVAERAKRWALNGWTALLILFLLTSIVGYISAQHLFANYIQTPIAWAVPFLVVIFLAATRNRTEKENPGRAFTFSALTITGLIGVLGIAGFPFLVYALNTMEHGLSIYKASASHTTLMTMLIIALIGMPIVIAYSAYVYYILRGKVQVEDEGY